MPYFAYRLSDRSDFTYYGSAPCHGWMARLDSHNIPNTEDCHIEELKIHYYNLREMDLVNQQGFKDVLLKFANSLPGFSGRATSVDPFVYRTSDNAVREVTNEEQAARSKRDTSNDFCYKLDGLPTDVLMTYLFMFRNIAHPNAYSVIKYLLSIGVPHKVACVMMSIFYASRSVRMGSEPEWFIGLNSGDSTIVNFNTTTIADLRNLVYGTKVIGKQYVWGSDDNHPSGYIRDGWERDSDGNLGYISKALSQSGLDVTLEQIDDESNVEDGNMIQTFNNILTMLVGKDFNITEEVLNEEVQYVGR